MMASLIVMEKLGERKMQNFPNLIAKAGDLKIQGSTRNYRVCKF